MRMIVIFIVLLILVGLAVFGIVRQIKGPPMPEGSVEYKGAGETNRDLASPENTLYLNLESGRVTIRMRPDLAPKHVARIKELVRDDFYDGTPFHRVIEDFMAQTGDPTGTGQGGSGVHIPAEFSSEPFKRGVVGMARMSNRDSADSQFFIMLGDAEWLNNSYTVWGEVIDGMEHVDAIKKGDAQANGKVSGEPDRVISMEIKADVE